MIVDTHVHAYEHHGSLNGRGDGRAVDIGLEYPNGTYYDCMRPYLGDKQLAIETYIEKYMIPHGIDKGVLLQGICYSMQHEYFEEIVKRYPGRFIASCCVDPCSPYKEQMLTELMNKNIYKIFKYEMSYEYGWGGVHEGLRVNGPEFDDIYELAAKHNMVMAFDLGTWPQPSHRYETLVDAAKKHPDIKFCACHLACPSEPINDRFRNDIDMLATCDNIWYDLSCVPHFMHIKDQYPFEPALELIEYAADKVGTEKLMWGSDLPCTVVGNTFTQIFDFIKYSKKFSSKDFDNIYGDAAAVCFDLK